MDTPFISLGDHHVAAAFSTLTGRLEQLAALIGELNAIHALKLDPAAFLREHDGPVDFLLLV